MWKKYRNQGLSIIAINTYPNETGGDTFFAEHGISFHHLIDDGKVYKEGVLELYGHPYAVLLNQDKKAIALHIGYNDGDEHELERLIISLLQ